MKYITKEIIKSLIRKDKYVEIVAPMGCGKTTATLDLATEYAKDGKRTLILTPFSISAEEYRSVGKTNLETIQNIADLIAEDNIEVDYILTFIEKGIAFVDGLYSEDGMFQNFEPSSNEVFQELKSWFTREISQYDLIAIDEVDFSTTQAFMTRKVQAFDFEVEEQTHISISHCLTSFFLTIMNTDVYSFSISANRLEIPPSIRGSVDETLLRNNFNKETAVVSEIESSINIKSITEVITSDYKGTDKYDFVYDLIGSMSKDGNKTLFFKSGKWTKNQAATFDAFNVLSLVRVDNARYELDKDKNMSTRFNHSKTKLIGVDGEESLLSDSLFGSYNAIAINTSSSRSVSLTETYKDSKVNIVIFSGSVTSTITQVMGRFRKADVNVYFVKDKEDKRNILHEIKKKDEFLIKSGVKVNRIFARDARGTGLVDRIKHGKGERVGEAVGKAKGKAIGKAIGKSKGKAIGKAKGQAIGKAVGKAVGQAVGEAIGKSKGKAVSAKTIIKRELLEEFVNDFKKDGTINSYFETYKIFCEEKTFGKKHSFGLTTFKKILKEKS